MVESGVEFVQHPGSARSRHQPKRACDLVGEVEFAPASLGAGERGQGRRRNSEESLSALQRLGGAPSVAQCNEAFLLLEQTVLKGRHSFRKSNSRDPSLRLTARMTVPNSNEESL